MRRIFFFNADETVKIKNKQMIKNLICWLFKKEKIKLEKINYVFCSDEYLLKINQQYLRHETLTDIITFPLSETGKPVAAEIYISLPRIRENAKIFGTKYENELLRVMIHGALHLCGYKDKKKSEQLQMRAKENYYLSQFNVPREAID